MSMHTHKYTPTCTPILDQITWWPHPLKITEFLLPNIQHFQIMLGQRKEKPRDYVPPDNC